MAVYLITFKKSKGRDTRLVEMPNEAKLLKWLSENATRCDTIVIQREEA